MRNPCRDCERLALDKNDPICMGCEKRLAYARGEGRAWDMNPLINSSGVGGKVPAVAGFRPNVCRNDKEGSMENQAEFFSTKVCRGEVCRAISSDGVDRPLSSFGPDTKAKDGHKGYCRMCEAFLVSKIHAKKTKAPAPDPKDYALNYKGRKNVKFPPSAFDTQFRQTPLAKGEKEETLAKKEKIKEPKKARTSVPYGKEEPAAMKVFLDIRIGLDPLTIGRLKELLEPVLKGKAKEHCDER